jgi:ubiquinone biosynthesis protein UbiJ
LDAYQRQKDILLMMVSLLSAVTGYYFGRVPGERGADAARKAQSAAEQSSKEIRTAGAQAVGKFESALSRMSAGQHTDEVAGELRTAVDSFRATLL